jgi:PPOX class probable F420-dependent enzyme
MPGTIPPQIQGQKYVSLATFRKNGKAVHTPVWIGEGGGKLYVMTRSDSGKYKRIRNNPQVRVAPCTMRGRITGPEFVGMACVLEPERWPQARETIHRKYWMARIPFLWSKQNVYVEIEVGATAA